MRKFKFFLNFEKEEKWLEDMARQGCRLIKAGFGYSFVSAPPEQVIIKTDYRIFKRKQDFLDYCSLFEDSGWQHIAGTKNTGAQYFTRVRDSADEDIFSDAASRAGRYKRFSDMWLSLVVAFIPILAAHFLVGGITMASFLDFKALYFTPGLWDMSGFDFWRHFLFETPFALMRSPLPLLIMFLCMVLYLIGYFAAWKAYKKIVSADNQKCG